MINFSVNSNATTFYKKWRKDTLFSLFFATPLFLILFIVLPLIVNGLSIGLFIFFLFPVTYVGLGFIYTPYFKRRQIINFIIKDISVLDDGKIVIKTFEWFYFSAILATFEKSSLKMKESVDVDMLKEKKVFLLKNSTGKSEKVFYLVQDFFTDFDDITAVLSKA